MQAVNALSGRLLKGKNIEGIHCEEVYVPSSDGEYQIRVRIYRPINHSGKLPVMLYNHGGGYIAGRPEQSSMMYERFLQSRPCVIIAPDYRKAFTKPFPAGLNDCYDTLLWAKANAETLGITDKVMIAGHSAGGGLTAAVTLRARDTQDVDIAFQMPIYPMIDDQQPLDPSRYMKAPIWDTAANKAGWNACLSDLHKQGAAIPAYAAPSRNTDYQNFPPTITFVGTVEPFYDETLAYVDALKKADIPALFKEFEGGFHAFDSAYPKTSISKAALDFTFDSYAAFYDQYVSPAECSMK